MTLVTPSQSSPNGEIKAASINDPVNQIAAVVNGQLDDSNISGVSGSKLADDTVVTSKIPDNGVTAPKLATNAIKLGKGAISAQITTTSTSNVQATGLTATVTIPAGGRSVKITAMLTGIGNATSGQACAVNIWSGTVGSGTQLQEVSYVSTSAGSTIPATIVAEHTPSAGSVTYNVGYRASGGTAAIAGAALAQSFLLVEAI